MDDARKSKIINSTGSQKFLHAARNSSSCFIPVVSSVARWQTGALCRNVWRSRFTWYTYLVRYIYICITAEGDTILFDRDPLSLLLLRMGVIVSASLVYSLFFLFYEEGEIVFEAFISALRVQVFVENIFLLVCFLVAVILFLLYIYIIYIPLV